MRSIKLTLLAASALFGICHFIGSSTLEASAPCKESEAPLAGKPDRATLSRALGHFLVRHLNTPGVEHDVKRVIEGMLAELEGKEPPLSEEALVAAISDLQAAHIEGLSQTNLAQAEAFLAKNATEKNVVSVSPELQYTITKEGSGQTLNADSTPKIHFTCKLLDGTLVSSTYESGEAITLPMGDALAGIRDGMLGMKQGEKRCLYIHPELGFGSSSHLPPNSLLVFEVELIDPNAQMESEDSSEIDVAQTQ